MNYIPANENQPPPVPAADPAVTPEQWWTKHATLLADKMRVGGVKSFRILQTPWGTYEFEVTPTEESLPVLEAIAPARQTADARERALEDLCGSILATLRVNRLRHTLTSANDQQLDDMIESWSRRLREL
jgi:hypothetical protein